MFRFQPLSNHDQVSQRNLGITSLTSSSKRTGSGKGVNEEEKRRKKKSVKVIKIIERARQRREEEEIRYRRGGGGSEGDRVQKI